MEASFITRKVIALGLNVHGVGISNRLIVGGAKAAFISYRLFIRLFFNTEKRSRLREAGCLDFVPFFLCRFASMLSLRNKVFQIVLSTYGIKLYCRCQDRYHDYALLTNREYELLDRWFLPKKGDIVIDVGAHIGIYTMVCSRLVGASGKVIARCIVFSAKLELDDMDLSICSSCIFCSRSCSIIPPLLPATNIASYLDKEKGMSLEYRMQFTATTLLRPFS